MAISFLLKIDTTDVTGNIVQNTYNVNRVQVYKDYQDANGVTHRRHIRDKIQGEFQMVFAGVTEYEAFKTLVDSVTSQANYSVPVTAYDNKSGMVYTINAFLDYEPTIKQTVGLREYIDVFNVKIEER